VTFIDLSVRLSSEVLNEIDAAIERIRPALTDRQEFVELAVEWTLASQREESELLMLGLEDE
jgi:hypothetical protein